MPNSDESSEAGKKSAKKAPDLANEKGRQSGGKLVKDWLKIVIPLVVAVATIWSSIWFGFRQSNDQNRHNQQLAEQQYQDTTLRAYIDNIRDLLLHHNLAHSAPQAEVTQIARVQTLSTIRTLSENGNKIVFQFLHDADLIGTQNAVINLSDADLSGANLTGANLSNLDLIGATLTGAQLNGADLSHATLNSANLNHAHLRGANLSGAFIFDAQLNGANLSNSVLNDANLTGAGLSGAVMDDATLTGASLSGAILTNAELNGAHLSAANLSGANLAGADLSGADFSDAILTTAGLTSKQKSLTAQQLSTVRSCTFAVLPLGLKCPHQPAVTLTYWYTENSSHESDVIKNLISQFQEANPKIRIKAVNTNYFQTESAFESAAQQGRAPDIFRSDVTWVPQLASQGYLLDINPYIQHGVNGYLPGPLGYDRYQGQYYGLPQVTDFLALLYNRKELEKAHIAPPANMSDFKDDVQTIVTSGAAHYGFETDGTAYSALPFLYTFGGGMLGQHGRILISDQGSINGLDFLLKLNNVPGHNGAKPVHVNFSNSPTSDALAEFKSGAAAMIFGGPYFVSTILDRPSIFSADPDNLGVAPIPACPLHTSTCRAGQARTPNGGQSYVISAKTLHPREAYKFIEFMSSMNSQIQIAEHNQTLPTLTSAYTAVSGEHFIREFENAGKKMIVCQSDSLQPGHLIDLLNPQIAAALNGAATATAALNEAAYEWNQLLAGSSQSVERC
jgi:arabinogalactan oligomer / maltooligosaccharide transport system substrate-binding protein